MNEGNHINRQNFLKAAIFGIAGLVSVSLGLPAIAYIISPATKATQAQNWIRLGSISKVEIGTPTMFKVKVERQTGWIANQEELSTYVITENGRDFIAMSSICTHLGCHIRWISERAQFFCPCHNGVFDKDGQVVSGPPPRPLDRYELKVEDNQLYILGS